MRTVENRWLISRVTAPDPAAAASASVMPRMDAEAQPGDP